MANIEVRAGVYDGSVFEQLHLFGDQILLRVTDAGEIQVTEFSSEDRSGPPPHSHPWDEVEYVIDGEVEFFVEDRWTRGGSGTVQMLPRGTAHSIRVPDGGARVLMITIGAPYDVFARDVAALGADGYPPIEQLIEIAERHGLRPMTATP